jgi:hypothetical protein
MQVAVREAAVGEQQGNNCRAHQQYAAGGFAVDEFIEWRDDALEHAFPGCVVDAFLVAYKIGWFAVSHALFLFQFLVGWMVSSVSLSTGYEVNRYIRVCVCARPHHG